MTHGAPGIGGHPPTRYARVARWLSETLGSAATAGVLAVVFVAWVVVGAATDYPRWWELVVTVGFPFLTIALLVVIQHTQTHGNHALHFKLDEIIRAHGDTSDAIAGVEEASEEDLDELRGRRQSRSSNSSIADRNP